MSLFGAMNTAVSGLTAQSAAFSNISDDISNSQTTGFKGVSTSFADYLTSSTATANDSGAVDTTPEYENDVQGTITQSTNPLALAISGNGFFNVSTADGDSSDGTAFSKTQDYTRDGDFSVNNDNYLVNDVGAYADGYNVDPATGALTTGDLQPIKIDTSPLPAVASTSIDYAATLPATLGSSSASSQVSVYDSAGASHEMTLDWTQSATSPSTWTLNVSSPDIDGGASLGTATATFNANGTMASLVGSGGLSGNDTTAGSPASLSLSPNFGGAGQPMTLSLGTLGTTSGVTLGTGSSYNLSNLSADGSAVGNYTGVTMTSGGDVVASYDNSETRVVAHIPIATFAAPDQLQRQSGQMFTATSGSGAPTLLNANQDGAGQIVVGSTEGSNVDIATNLTQLITAQQAYGANAKMITAADQMLQVTLQMKQ